jgi:hypothetical protein
MTTCAVCGGTGKRCVPPITEMQERGGQFSSRERAIGPAATASRRLEGNYIPVETVTWRDGEMLRCWVVRQNQ